MSDWPATDSLENHPEVRCEVKAICEERAWAAMLGAIRLAPAGIRSLHPDRIVQSIYFDTHDGAAVAENLAGVAAREKLRFRFYGGLDTDGSARGQLECKRRVNSLGTKEVYVLDRKVNLVDARRQHLVNEISEMLEATGESHAVERAIELRRREPAQWIRYRRRYLTTADQRVRITLDTELHTFDQRYASRIQCKRATVIPRLLVIELKAAASDRGRIEALLQDLPIVVSKNSKFTLASAPRHAATPSVCGW